MVLSTRTLRWLTALTLLVWVGACAGGSRGGATDPRPAKVVNVDVEPLRVEVARGPDGKSRVDVYDARQLFDQGSAALDRGAFDRALSLYDRLIDSFPASPLVPPAMFNAGLALEGMGDLTGAAGRYLDVVRRAPSSRHALDAHIRAGAVMAELERWGDALRIYDEVAARSDLAAPDQVELFARRGYVLVETRRDRDAERALTSAIALAERARSQRTPSTDAFAAMAHYYLAELPRREAEAMKLELPESRLEERIEAKAKLVLAAQRHFEDTIRVGDLLWATAAAYQLGAMQQDLWRSLVAAPVPTRLKAPEAAVYTAEVRGLARAHLEKALAAHQMNLEVASRNKPTPWTERSRQRIDDIRRILAGSIIPLPGPPPIP